MTGDPFLIPDVPYQLPRPRRPLLPPSAFESFEVKPYWQRATCEQVGCVAYSDGWTTKLDETRPQQAGIAHYIRAESGRRFTETKGTDGHTVFRFPPGQMCFQAATHRRPADVQELYLRRGGDWRAHIGPGFQYIRPDQFMDDLHTRTGHLAQVRSRAGTAGP